MSLKDRTQGFMGGFGENKRKQEMFIIVTLSNIQKVILGNCKNSNQVEKRNQVQQNHFL